MRITKEKAAENRAALIRAASKLFRERGIDGVGVAEISKEAGLTHGALYAHFRSKEALALEALSHGLDHSNAVLSAHADGAEGTPDLAAFVDRYLAPAGRDDYAGHCPITASASELGRQDKAISVCFAEGYMAIVRAFERQIEANDPGCDARGRAMAVVSMLVGSVTVARGTAKGDPAVSGQVLAAARAAVDELMCARPRG